MSIIRRGAVLPTALLAASLSLFAQSVAVTPTNATVPPGATVQFFKSTNMLSPETVTWTVSGMPGGDPSVGTIDPTGLYKAPAAPAQNPVVVRATSTANPAFFASATVTITASTITVKPANPTLQVGATLQFSVEVKNLPSAAVTWSLGPTAMNVGAITPAGLYTAPATIPAQNPITVKALSAADGKTVGVTYVYLVNNGPTITAATPNPLPSGSYTITVYGTGFKPGATIFNGGVALSATGTTTATSVSGKGYQGPATSTTLCVRNPDSVCSNSLTIAVTGAGQNPNPTPSPAPVVAPSTVTVPLGASQQFTAANATSWTASAGTITSAGVYTAPAAMPASTTVAITAAGAGGQGAAAVTLIPNTPPSITGLSLPSLPLGVFSATVTGTGFLPQSAVQLNGKALHTTFANGALAVTGFAGTSGPGSLTVMNGPLASAPFAIQIGTPNALVSAAAARRFLEQAAFGPTPQEADHVQAVGFDAWITEQFNMPQISNYNGAGNQGGLPSMFLANAVNNTDQLRQRVAFALSQIFVTSLNKLIWNATMVPYQHTLLAGAFTTYRKILEDVTLSPAMGFYLDMANNARANPNLGTVANENYAREVLQLFSLGTAKLNQDGTSQMDTSLVPPQPFPAYDQFAVSEFARAFTGWTYAPPPGGTLQWNAFLNNPNAPMMPFPAMHDAGSKTLLNGVVAQAGLTPQTDLKIALDNIAGHTNVAPFISKQLIQHLVKSNPTPAYVQRIANAFTLSQGDMKTVIRAILLDQEARANDEGAADQPTDGHLQSPALFTAGLVRAFGGTLTAQNIFAYQLTAMGQDLYTPPSVFNYYSPSYTVANTNGLKGPEFQIHNPNSAILRENLVATTFNTYQNPVISLGTGGSIDLSPFVPLASSPATLMDAIDLTLTRGKMPATMKQTIQTAVTADSGGNLRRVQTAIYLTLQSSYYNVWH